MRQPTLLFLPASQETCHSCSAALSFPHARPHDAPAPARSVARDLCSVTGAEARGNPRAESFTGCFGPPTRVVMAYRFASYLYEYFDWRAKPRREITIR